MHCDNCLQAQPVKDFCWLYYHCNNKRALHEYRTGTPCATCSFLLYGERVNYDRSYMRKELYEKQICQPYRVFGSSVSAEYEKASVEVVADDVPSCSVVCIV